MCLRDFEAFISGATLIKPDMDHVQTWPNIYKKNVTYISIPWKIENWNEVIEEIINNKKLLLQVARRGQIEYKKLWSINGMQEFCNHFINLILN